jgi:hypothetical protein
MTTDNQWATVTLIAPGTLELWCICGVQSLIGPVRARAYLERKAAKHNETVHAVVRDE